MPPAARGHRKPCRVSRRLAEVDALLNDEKRDRITDVVRVHLDVFLMVTLLNKEGWAGVVVALPRRVRKDLLALADELEAEVLQAVVCLQRW